MNSFSGRKRNHPPTRARSPTTIARVLCLRKKGVIGFPIEAATPPGKSCGRWSPATSQLELLKRSGAEGRIETLAVDGNSAELCEIRARGNVVVLVSLISLELSQFDTFSLVRKKVVVVLRILRIDQEHMHIGSIGCLETREAQHQFAFGAFVDRRSTAG